MRIETAQILGMISLGMILGEVRGADATPPKFSELSTEAQQANEEGKERYVVEKLYYRNKGLKKIYDNNKKKDNEEISRQYMIKTSSTIMLKFLCKILVDAGKSITQGHKFKAKYKDFETPWESIKKGKSSEECITLVNTLCYSSVYKALAYKAFISEESDDCIKISTGYKILIKNEEGEEEELEESNWMNVMGSMILGKLIKASFREEDKNNDRFCELIYSIFRRLAEIWGQNIQNLKLEEQNNTKKELFALYNDADLCNGLPEALSYPPKELVGNNDKKQEAEKIRKDLKDKYKTFLSKESKEEARLAAERLLKQLGMAEFPIDIDTSNILKYDVDRIVATVKSEPDEYNLHDIYDRFKKSRTDLDIRALDVSNPNDFLDVMKNQTIRAAFEEYINPINYGTTSNNHIKEDPNEDGKKETLTLAAAKERAKNENGVAAKYLRQGEDVWKPLVKAWADQNGIKIDE